MDVHQASLNRGSSSLMKILASIEPTRSLTQSKNTLTISALPVLLMRNQQENHDYGHCTEIKVVS